MNDEAAELLPSITREVMPKDLSVVIPAYNEEERLLPALRAAHAFFRNENLHGEVIVVDDGSRDRTARVVKEFQTDHPDVRLIIFEKNYGKGRAVKEGVLAAGGKQILVMDADLATPLGELKKLLPVLEAGFDGALGTRVVSDGASRVVQTPMRKFSGRIFNAIVTLLILKGFTDTQCGFKLFRREAIQEVCREQILDGFSFDIELLYLLQRRGRRLKEVPINWTAQPGSKVRLLRDSWRMLCDILTIRRLHKR